MMVPQAYAAWRAECVKADIQMGLIDDDTEVSLTTQEKKEYKREYFREYRRKHRARRNEQSRKSYAKIKAARLLEQSKTAQ